MLNAKLILNTAAAFLIGMIVYHFISKMLMKNGGNNGIEAEPMAGASGETTTKSCQGGDIDGCRQFCTDTLNGTFDSSNNSCTWSGSASGYPMYGSRFGTVRSR